MTLKALLFGREDIEKKMLPLYESEALHGAFEIVARAKLENDKVTFVYADDRVGGG